MILYVIIPGACHLCDPNLPAPACEYCTCKILTRTNTNIGKNILLIYLNLIKLTNSEKVPFNTTTELQKIDEKSTHTGDGWLLSKCKSVQDVT